MQSIAAHPYFVIVNQASLQTDSTAFDSFIYLVQNENTVMHVLTYSIYLIT